MDMEEVRREIERLEHSDTSYHNCEKLAVLYAVADRQRPQEKPMGPYRSAEYSLASEPSSEFMDVALKADKSALLKVLDEHMNSIRLLYPNEYKAVLRRIRGE